MAKPMMSAKAKTIRIWLWVIILSFLGLFFTMKYTVLGKNTIINDFVSICAQTTPKAPNWQKDLQQFGYVGDTQWLPQAYCECVLFPAFQNMSETRIRSFTGFNEAENAMIQQNHSQCLKDLKPKT